MPQVYAQSPYFARQEITDDRDDPVEINYLDSSVKPINRSDTDQDAIASSIDISDITYFSDGRTFNATLWLTQGFDDTLFRIAQKIDFGVYIDVNPESTTGTEGVSYHKQIVWPSGGFFDLPGYVILTTNNSWIDNIHEVISGGGHRYLKIAETKNYTKLFEQLASPYVKSGHTYSIPLSLDLKDVNFPHKYKVLFYFSAYLSDYERISDYTNWLDVPPATFFLSTFPNNIELRPGESKDITGVLKSTTGSIANVSNIMPGINSYNLTVHPYGTSYTSLLTGIHPAKFHISVPSADKIQAGEYTIPLAVNVSTGSTLAPPEFIGGADFESSANSKGYMNTVANMTVKILEPFSLGEQFKGIWDVYGQPISIVAGGFAGGAASLIFDRLKRKKDL